MKHSNISGFLWVAAAAITSSIGGVCFLSIPLPTLASNSLRCGIAALLSLFFLKKDKAAFRLNFSTLSAGLCFALTTQFFSLAVPLAGAGVSTLLLNTSPLFILLWNVLFFKKAPLPQQVVAATMALLGIWMIVQNHTVQGNLWGIVFGLCSGACYSGIFFAAQGTNAHPPSAFLLGQTISALCGSIFLLGAPWQQLTFGSVACILLLGLVQLGLSYRCMAKGLASTSPLAAGLICSIEPVLAALWANIFAKEPISLFFVLGSILVLGGIAIQQCSTFTLTKTN